jgi:hypothetical protein
MHRVCCDVLRGEVRAADEGGRHRGVGMAWIGTPSAQNGRTGFYLSSLQIVVACLTEAEICAVRCRFTASVVENGL